MCGACGRSVVSDPALGPIRTMRQHLIVAQTINGVCQSWPGAPKVAATRDGWLVSAPTGATAAVVTVEALWSAVLRGCPGVRSSDLHRAVLAAVDLAESDWQPEQLSLRVLSLGRDMAPNEGTAPGS